MTKTVLFSSPHKIVLFNSIYKHSILQNIDLNDTKKCISRIRTLAGNHELQKIRFGVKTAKLKIQRRPRLISSSMV